MQIKGEAIDFGIMRGEKPSLKYQRIVYLDQWVWVKLARVHYGKKEDNIWRDTYLKVLNAAACQLAIFPLDVNRCEEIMQITDSEKKLRFTNFAFLISGGHTLRAWPVLQIIEILCYLVHHNINQHFIRNNMLVGHGIQHAYGRTIEITENSGKLPRDFLEHLSASISYPNTLWCLLLHGGKNWRVKYTKAVKPVLDRLESLRLTGKKYLNYEEIVKWQLRESGVNFIKDMLKMADELNIDIKLPSFKNEDEIIDFLTSVPTLNVSTRLNTTRDVLNRPVSRNDILDLAYLYVAIPYCDFVFTERFWAKQANDCKFGEKYGTIISSKPQSLIEFLPDSGLKNGVEKV